MTTAPHTPSTYAALRYGGASQTRAQAELALSAREAKSLEHIFRVVRPGKMLDRMRPRFARHDEHVVAALAAGGYPALKR